MCLPCIRLSLRTCAARASPILGTRKLFAFLHEEESNIYVGVGMQLQRLAWAQGTAHGDRTRTRRTELLALEWMASALVQGPIYLLCEEALASSLIVERRLGDVNQWET